MKYVEKNAKAPVTNVLVEQSMKKILVDLGYDETSISNSSIIERYGYTTVVECSNTQPTTTSILVADKENDGSWSMKWMEQNLYDTIKDKQVITIKMRAKRNELLTKSDWTQSKDIPNEISSLWTTYRQSLRDVTQQPNFPYAIDWPTPPQ